MHISDLTLAGFIFLSGIRCVSYLPQLVRIVRDRHGASAISYMTWSIWTLTHLTTALYAVFNLGDVFLAAVSCVYALCCASVVVLTAFKRARHRMQDRYPRAAPTRESARPLSAGDPDLLLR